MNATAARGALRPLCAAIATLALAAGCATTPASAPDAQSGGIDDLGARLLDDYIRPQTATLVRSTQALDAALDVYCTEAGSRELQQTVDARLRDVTVAWAGVEFLRFGPLVEQNRLEQFFFWPDPRGVMQRQLRTLLSAADPARLEPASLRQQSVAVQGLPALEYALHGDGARAAIAANDAVGVYRCAFAAAVAANLARIAGEIDAGWNAQSAQAREFAAPAAGNDLYRNAGEVASEVLKALSTALHVARDQKLAPALGEDAASARGTLLPLYRSGLTAEFISAQAAALERFQAAAGFGAMLAGESRWIDASLRDELQRVQQDFADLPIPADLAIADEDARDLLVHAALLISNARALVDEYLAPALGVNLGFNALDGD